MRSGSSKVRDFQNYKVKNSEAYRRFLDDTDIEICPWVQFEDLELKTALNLNAKISETTDKNISPTTSVRIAIF